jgi:hypothetical protein
MILYPVIKRIRFSEDEGKLLSELKRIGINESRFIRQAVREKLQRDMPEILKRNSEIKVPF